MKNSIIAIVILLFVASTNAFAQTAESGGFGLSPAVMNALLTPQEARHDSHQTKCKGAFLRTKTVKTEKSFQLVASLAVSEPFQQPTLKLEKQEFRTYTEVRLYETLLRTFTPGEDEDHGTYDYERIEGELWEGETSERTVSFPAKPLVSSPVKINGIPLTTDKKGLVMDSENLLDILGIFDNLGTRKSNFLIEVPDLEPVDFPMTRTMPKRLAKDDRGIDEEEQYELLLAYGLDFALSKGEPEQDALQIKAILPENFAFAEAGKPFPLKVQISNPSTRQTSCLLARTFSRCPGLDGKLFYFGAILPGETKEFTRMVVVDKTEKINSAHLELAFSDSWGILKQRIPLTLTVIH